MRRREPLSQLIRWMDDRDPRRPTDVSHAALCVGSDQQEGPMVISVWPMADREEIASDVVYAPLRVALRPYDRVIARRHRAVAPLSSAERRARLEPVLAFAWQETRRAHSGTPRFANGQLVASGLALAAPMLDGLARRLVVRAAAELDAQVRAEAGNGLMCPELIVRAFNQQGSDLPLLPEVVAPTPASPELAPAGSDRGFTALGDLAGRALRASLLFACDVALDVLCSSSTQPSSTSLGSPDPHTVAEYTTPGDLLRTDELVTLAVVDAWDGELGAPGAEAVSGRASVCLERRWEPGVPPTPLPPG